MNEFVELGEILNGLGALSSRNDKINLLNSHKDNLNLKIIFKLAYDPYIKYNIARVGGSSLPFEKFYDFDLFLEDLDDLKERRITGNAALDLVGKIFKSLPAIFGNYLEKILKKDLKIGVSVATINKIWPDWIPEFKLALCERWKKIKPLTDIDFPAIAEPKIDAVRGLAFIYSDGKVEIKSRSGLVWKNFKNVEIALSNLSSFCREESIWNNGMVLDGEIQNKDFQSTMSNASRIHDIQYDNTIFTVWDAIPMEEFLSETCSLDLAYRKDFLHFWLFKNEKLRYDNVKPIEYEIVYSIDEIIKSFEEYYNRGFEGTVIKNLNSKYIYSSGTKRGKAWIKYKLQDYSDLKGTRNAEYSVRIVGSYLGDRGTKNEHILGGFYYTGIAQYEDNTIEIQGSVGGGFKDSQRNDFWNNRESLIGSIMDVQSQEVTMNKKGEHSLRFPVFQIMRPDLTEVDYE